MTDVQQTPSAVETLQPEARRTHRGLVLGGLMLAMVLAAIEGTIVATAMPSIAGRLGGFALYSWVFSSYLLMQAVTTPIFGKLADVYGRKPVFIAGVTIFLIGSVLCGFAPTMASLVAFRFLQGIGAGAVIPITSTLVADLFTLAERGRVQGYLAGVWGFSSVVGPLAGGLIVQHADWHWIFWLNVPFGILAIVLIVLFLHERLEHHERRIDLVGTGLLLVGLSALMLALTQGEQWGLGAAGGLVALAVATLGLFVRHDRRVAESLMHLELWNHPIIRPGNLVVFAFGIAMIGMITFLPTYVQGVLGRSAMVAGFSLTGMTLGWPVASVMAGRLFVRTGVRRLVRVGGVMSTVGGLLVVLLADQGPWALGAGALVMGAGFGLLSTTFIIAIQSSVPWAQRGVVTASNMLMRNLGNAVGAAMLGGVLNWRLARYLERRGVAGQISLDSVRQLVGEGGPGPAALSPAQLTLLHDGLSRGLHLVLWAICLFAAMTLVLSWWVPELDGTAGTALGPAETGAGH